ncbi:hypothetical protein [Desulfosporosinus sp. FKA]|uniref:hypothetical protein n=1 Tax=Desulfosporosinus sp. FKA TaxID=1969834 RepID=UPI000B49C894|nr:hypothetical protein [Desulfosporosinus sp. FKA]
MSSILSLLSGLHDGAEFMNIAMPLVLARYHLALVVVGILGLVIGVLVYKQYKDSGQQRITFIARGFSLICIFILQAGAVGWFITPLYDFVLKTSMR